MTEIADKQSWLDRPLTLRFPKLTIEIFLFSLLLLLAVVSRFYDLGERVISHDEGLHVYYSWKYAEGLGYSHSPGTHGPLQFHLIALTYLLFGDSDFTARLPHAITSVLTILMVWKWRRSLGRAGALVAAGLMLISPFFLYYGRYARNEVFVGLFGLLTLYAILRYLETGRHRYIYLLTLATVLHFTAKETSFIYTAQALLFLAFYLIQRATRLRWAKPRLYNPAIIVLSVSILLLGVAFGFSAAERSRGAEEATAETTVPGETVTEPLGPQANPLSTSAILGAAAATALVAAALLFGTGLGWEALRRERSFDLLMLLGTLVLPQLAAFLVRLVDRNPLAYYFSRPQILPFADYEGNRFEYISAYFRAIFAADVIWTALFLVLLFALSIIFGLWWNNKGLWMKNALLFWGIYALLYTSLFTNWQGFFTGTVGSLGHWLAQQGVARGGQPWYYYALIQIPLYEFLPAIGLGLAVLLKLRQRRPAPEEAGPIPRETRETVPESTPFFSLILWWALSSFAAYTIAGEKMPWLTYHITLPMILLTGWALGQVLERVDWASVREKRGWLILLLMGIFLVAFFRLQFVLIGTDGPFQGKELAQLQTTYSFLGLLVILVASGAGAWWLSRGQPFRQAARLATLAFFGLLAVLTIRAATRAAYVNPNDATEYLVYAHGAGGVREAMAQIETISERTSGADHTIQIAYDNAGTGYGTSWPFTWYLRHYANLRVFSEPDATLRDVPIILLDESNYDEIDPVVGDNYYRFDYIRMVWPDMDYYNLSWARVKDFLTLPSWRAALRDLWLNRDYTAYALAAGRGEMTPANWTPSGRMRLYIRKDIAAQIWEYGLGGDVDLEPDPYQAGMVVLSPDRTVGSGGIAEGQFNAPRGVVVAPDGSLFVADSRNHRIQHFSADGLFLNAWGAFSESSIETPLPGTFNEPWGVAVSPDGEIVYVTDTWNHRVQAFAPDGVLLWIWGHPGFGQTSDPYGFWGPRGIAVDGQGRVYVADTGNKRILVFDAEGNYLTEFGAGGMNPGQLDEPVGVAVDARGLVYVADTWNRRIQVFTAIGDDLNFTPYALWDVSGWYGDSLDNKPFLAVDNRGNLFVTDPELGRVLQFTVDGAFVRGWGESGPGIESIGVAAAVAVDAQGRVLVTDAGNQRLLRFGLP